MNIARYASKVKRVVSDNSPVILTAIGVTGTITTAYLAAKASFKAVEVLEEATVNDPKFNDRRPDNKEKFQLLWKLYIPAVSTGAVTCGAIVFANRIGTKRAAAMATAYTLSERAYAEYKDKVVEQIGKEKDEEIRKEIAQDRLTATPPDANTLGYLPGTGQVLCMDAFSGRYFMSDKETIRRAENDIMYKINRDDFSTLTSFYDKIGLPATSISDEIGWNTEHPIDVSFSPIETPDGKLCLAFDFKVVPVRDPWSFR